MDKGLTTAEKCEAVIKDIHDYVQQNEAHSFTIIADLFGVNTLTIYKGDDHTHVGNPDGTWDQLIDNLYDQLVKGKGLSWA